MRSSEDNADDEFVFVANKMASARGYYHHNVVVSLASCSSSSLPACYTTSTRSPRPHPRLNHLQPIPTTLDLMPSPVPRTLTNASNTTTSKSKATPLPPELIELLPPHLRENTIPDYTYSSSVVAKEEEAVPERPPLPTTYCPGDYSNLEEPTTPTTSPPTTSPPTTSPCSSSSSTHNYSYLSDIITSDPLRVLAATSIHATRASSLTSSRPSSRNSSSSNTHTASHTAPAALGLTDSGISSGGSSSSNSSNSSRSNSSRSLPRDGPFPRDGSRTSINGRPFQPPSPKFARSAVAATSSSSSPSSGSNNNINYVGSTCAAPSLTKVSYTAVLASDGERASMYRKLEALTPTPSPLLNNFRANSNPQAVTRAELTSSAAVEGRPHTRHVATAHTTVTAMGQCKSSVSHTSTPSHTPSSTPTQTPNQTPTAGRKAKTLSNGVSSAAVITHKGSNGRVAGGGGGREGVAPAPFSSSSPSPSRQASPTRSSTPHGPHSVNNTHTSSGVVHSSMGQIPDMHGRSWVVTPPSSPEMRRAWNVVGVPMDHSRSTPTKCRSPAASPVPRSGYSTMSGSDPDSIYDNLVVRHPPLAAPTPKSMPMASVPPTFTPVAAHSMQAHQYHGSSVRITPSPVPCGRPPSPTSQRRATSRSPSPTGAWVGTPAGGVGVVNPHYVSYYPSQDGHYGGCWVPVWGSSPQLYQGDGAPVVYPAYVYGGPPGVATAGGGPPPAAPPGVMCEGRSHSCDRMQSRPSPPPSPRNGRRSASPWRGGSASPVNQRHSPSPDPGSGRPPRPRRPPMRKSKTVEVGFLGVGAHQPPPPPPASATPTSMGEGGVGPGGNAYHPVVNYMQRSPSPQPPGSSQVHLHHLGHPSPAAYQRYVNQNQHPNFEVIHEQQMRTSCGHSSSDQSAHYPFVSSPYSSSSSSSSHLVNGGHDLASPSLVNSTRYSSPEIVHSSSSLSAKQGQAEVTKPKGSTLEDRVNRLEGDKDSLQLQVTVLSEQVEAQTEKIQDMDALLDQKKELLRKTEEQLQKEVMTRSSLETQRLELFSEISNMKLRQAAYERENVELRDKLRRSEHHMDHTKAQMAHSPSPSTISTLSTIPSSSPKISPAQPISISPTASPLPVASHDAREFLPPRYCTMLINRRRTPPPNARRKIEHFGTIPRQRESDLGGASTIGRTKGVMFGKGLHFLPFRVAGKRSTSAPNLAETEMQMIDDLPEGEYGSPVDGVSPPASSPRMNTLAGHRSPTTQHKTTGIKKIFTRLRRSSSGHLDSDLGEGDFRRGGMRATASARLGWTSPNTAFKEPNEVFRGWNIETVEAWLGGLGLSQYCAAVRSWSGAGHHVSQATPQHLDRDLGIRHPLHRKKLQLAISARVNGGQLGTPLARLDHAWVLRWLDDVGLPQYKDAFSEARIDGRVLNCLTYDDLAFLRLTNLLHVTSLKRGIQVLREHNFDPSVLKRRSVPDEDHRGRCASEVALWTNHRVMEWLRTVDLSEYAPNLRGSGVHGALMVYEVRFTSELLASLLSIPCGKTLLRRHLNTHFKELVGVNVVQEKRELEASTGHTPLTTSAKVKMPKKSQFSLKRRKTKSDLDFDDLLCPLDEKPPLGAIQDKEKEVRTVEVEEEVTESVKVEEEKIVSTDKETETNGDGRLC